MTTKTTSKKKNKRLNEKKFRRSFKRANILRISSNLIGRSGFGRGIGKQSFDKIEDT